MTKDGVLVSHPRPHARAHDRRGGGLPRPVRRGEDRRRGPSADWYVHDFTLAEIKRLDAGSWFDKKFAGTRILTFQEAIDLVRGKAGLYPELKDPEFYRQRGVNPRSSSPRSCKKNGLEADPKTPLILQSFDDATLKAAAIDLPTVPRVFLVSPQDAGRIDTPEKLKEIAAWATGIGPNKVILEKAPGHRRVGARGEADGDAVDLPRVAARQVPVGARRDEALPVHARRRRALHRQPRHVPADEVACRDGSERGQRFMAGDYTTRV